MVALQDGSIPPKKRLDRLVSWMTARGSNASRYRLLDAADKESFDLRLPKLLYLLSEAMRHEAVRTGDDSEKDRDFTCIGVQRHRAETGAGRRV